MSGEGEGGLRRWSRRKGAARDGAPEAEPEAPQKPKRGGAAPVADLAEDGGWVSPLPPLARTKIAPPMPPLAEPEEGEIAMEAASPEALALKARLESEAAAREEETEPDDRELTPEEEEAVKDLPPIKSLTKDSDFTPFFAQNVPDFLKRQAYKALWRRTPFFNIRDGLDDYDEDFSLIHMVGEAISDAKGTSKTKKGRAGAKKDGAPKDQKAQELAGEKEDREGTPEETDVEEDELGDVGEDGESDGEDEAET